MKDKKRPRNVVGPVIRKLRYEQDLSQPMLAARCQSAGWDLSRESLAKIESQLRWVADFELICLAKALRVEVLDLFPDRGKNTSEVKGMFKKTG